MGRKYMSNTPFQIEKVRGYSTKRKNCFNCKFYENDGTCWAKMTRVTMNNADVCNHFESRYSEIELSTKMEKINDKEMFDFKNTKFFPCKKYTEEEMKNIKKKELQKQQRYAKIREKKKIQKKEKEKFLDYVKRINYMIKSSDDIEHKKELLVEKTKTEILFSKKNPKLYKKIQKDKNYKDIL